MESEKMRQSIWMLSEGEADPGEDREKVEAHVRECRSCRAYRQLLGETDSLLRDAIREAEEPGALAADQPTTEPGRATVPLESTNPWWHGVRVLLPTFARAVAALLLVAAGALLASLWPSRGSHPVPLGPGTELGRDVLLCGGTTQPGAIELTLAVYAGGAAEPGRAGPSDSLGAMSIVQGTTQYACQRYEAAAASFQRAVETLSDRSLRLMALFARGATEKTIAEAAQCVCQDYETAVASLLPTIISLPEPRLRLPSLLALAAGWKDVRAEYLPKARAAFGQSMDTYQSILQVTEREPAYRILTAMAEHFLGFSKFELAGIEIKEGRLEHARLRLEEARGHYAKSLMLVPDYSKVAYNLWTLLVRLAAVAKEQGNASEAAQLAAEANEQLKTTEAALLQRLKEEPRKGRIHFSLAMLYAQQQDKKDQAVHHLTLAVQIDPTLSVLLEPEHVFDGLKARPEYKEIQKKAQACVGSPGSLFFDTDLPAGALQGLPRGSGLRGSAPGARLHPL